MAQGDVAAAAAPTNFADDDIGFALLNDLRAVVPLHPQHIRKLSRKGLFPPLINIGGRTCVRRRDLREWCRDPNGYRHSQN